MSQGFKFVLTARDDIVSLVKPYLALYKGF